ncbi:hypothetical protein [Sorangium sp. So ce854]|uniref:hypothetical protein n=1 Tax=Sorangium sp. So ce854 TaxID=3133322 RepID=UPI003F630F58
MRTAATVVAALAVTLSASPPAGAYGEVFGDKETWARSLTSRWITEMEFLNRLGYRGLKDKPRNLVSLLSFGVRIRVAEGTYAEAELPLLFGEAPLLGNGQRTPDTRAVLIPGNLTLGGHYARELSPWLVAYAGASVSLPLVWWPDARDLEVGDVALLSRAFFDTHRTFLNHLPLRARGGVEMEFEEIVQIRSDLTASLALSLSSDSTELVVEQGNEVQVGYTGVGVGLRIQEALLLTEPDKVQIALEPFANVDATHFNLFGRVGFLFGIDQPMGFGFGRYGLYTIRMTTGMKF